MGQCYQDWELGQEKGLFEMSATRSICWLKGQSGRRFTFEVAAIKSEETGLSAPP